MRSSLPGAILVNEQKIDKPGASVLAEASLRLLGDEQPFVSRGGFKLAGALDHWQIDVTGRSCLDVGASTGGFTDCLLQRGAAHVTAIDTGFGQIAMKLRNDPRVRLMERTNARLIEPGALDEPHRRPVTFPAGYGCLFHLGHVDPGAGLCGRTLSEEAVILVKPQFEAGREHVGKGGIVRDPAAHQLAVDKVAACLTALNCQVDPAIPSPITGAEGNQEFLLHARREAS